MQPIPSSLTGRKFDFGRIQAELQSLEFTLGGNWDYINGSFDRSLDGDAQKVWLRIPFSATRGSLDSEKTSPDAIIQLGTPYVLKHVYNEGSSGPEADYRTYSAMFDQFQEPVNADADVEPNWFYDAQKMVDEVERRFAR